MSSHTLTYFEIQKYNSNEPRFNGVYLRNNLHKVKDMTDAVYLDEYKSTGIHKIVLYVEGDNTTYFNSFGVFIKKKQMTQ